MVLDVASELSLEMPSGCPALLKATVFVTVVQLSVVTTACASVMVLDVASEQ